MRTEGITALTKSYVLDRVSQEEIFSRFLNISISVIASCAKNGTLTRYRSDDSFPSFGFKYRKNGTLICKDFGGDLHGDCFDVVGYVNLIDPTTNSGFMEVLKIIAKEFKLYNFNGHGYGHSPQINTDTYKPIIREPSVFEVYPKAYNFLDLKYWEKNGIDYDKLREHNVYSLEIVFINGKLFYDYNSKNNYKHPCFGYYQGKALDGREIWTIYIPTRKIFRKNGDQLNISKRIRKTKLGGIIKSKKDLMTIECAIEEITQDKQYFQGLDIYSESKLITKEQFSYLQGYWSDIPFTFSDFDRPGRLFGLRMQKLHKTTPLYITNGLFGTYDFKVKDIAQYHTLYGREKTLKLVEEVLNVYERDGKLGNFKSIYNEKNIIESGYDNDIPF